MFFSISCNKLRISLVFHATLPQCKTRLCLRISDKRNICVKRSHEAWREQWPQRERERGAEGGEQRKERGVAGREESGEQIHSNSWRCRWEWKSCKASGNINTTTHNERDWLTLPHTHTCTHTREQIICRFQVPAVIVVVVIVIIILISVKMSSSSSSPRIRCSRCCCDCCCCFNPTSTCRSLSPLYTLSATALSHSLLLARTQAAAQLGISFFVPSFVRNFRTIFQIFALCFLFSSCDFDFVYSLHISASACVCVYLFIYRIFCAPFA